MNNALIGAIVGINKPGFEVWWHTADSEAVVLCGDIATGAILHDAGLVLTAMSKFHFVRIAASGQREDLIAHADPKCGNMLFQRGADRLNGFLCHLGVARPIGDENAIKMKSVFGSEQVIIPGYGDNLDTAPGQATYNVPFGSAVDQGNRLFPFACVLDGCGGDFGDLIFLVGIVKRNIIFKDDLAKEGAVGADMLC